MEDRLTYRCPRCAGDVTERFYGPCQECRMALVATQGAPAPAGAATTRSVEVGAGRFEPTMHVVPNHVATKD